MANGDFLSKNVSTIKERLHYIDQPLFHHN